MELGHPLNAYLASESEEFVQLSDCYARLERRRLPLHAVVLAKDCRVFAQLFTSVGLPSAAAPTDLSAQLQGHSLQTVAMFLW